MPKLYLKTLLWRKKKNVFWKQHNTTNFCKQLILNKKTLFEFLDLLYCKSWNNLVFIALRYSTIVQHFFFYNCFQGVNNQIQTKIWSCCGEKERRFRLINPSLCLCFLLYVPTFETGWSNFNGNKSAKDYIPLFSKSFQKLQTMIEYVNDTPLFRKSPL
jgi:hypothetical protein